MRRTKLFVMSALVGTVAVGGWLHAQGSSSVELTGSDIVEIEQLWARYNQGWDFRDVELYLSAYSDDAVFTTGAGQAYVGKEAIKEYLTTAFANDVSATVTHNNFSILITPSADGARGRGYWLTMNVMVSPPVTGGTGYYEDSYVKTPNGWRIKSRTSTRGWAPRTWSQ